MADKKLNALDQVLDPNNDDNVVLFCASGKGIEFEQIAVIPYDKKVYAILKPVEKFEGIRDDEAFTFSIEEDSGEFFFNEANDEDIKNAVSEIYTKMWYEDFSEQGEKHPGARFFERPKKL